MSSSTDSDERTYKQIRDQDFADELEWLTEPTPWEPRRNELANAQRRHDAQLPHVHLSCEQSVAQPRQVPYVQSSYEQEVDSRPVCCYCGYAVQVVVRVTGNDIGRRIQQCPLFPSGCTYAEWIDEPFPPRAITYANDQEQAIRRLENEMEQLRFNRGN